MTASNESAALRDELLNLHRQLLERDVAFRAWDERVEQLEHEKQELSQRLEDAAAEIRELHGTIREMQATRLWRLGASFWSARDRMKGLLSRNG